MVLSLNKEFKTIYKSFRVISKLNMVRILYIKFLVD
jgi:hypothetical protein